MASPATLQKFADITDLNKKKKEYLKQLGDLTEWGPTKNWVMVAVFIGSKYIPGIIVQLERSDESLKEDIYQGGAGLLLKCGPTAFKEKDATGKLVDEPERPHVGDWVTFVPGEGRRIQINGIDCRYFVEDAILGRTPDPQMITYRNS